MSDTVERMGRIVAVTGAQAIILMDVDDRALGNEEKSPEIGTLLKVDTHNAVSLALVSALSSPTPSNNRSEREVRIIEAEFIGELPKDSTGKLRPFRRGISSYPALGDVVYRANRHELSLAYSFDSESAVRVGHIQQDRSIPAMIKVDEMLGKHFAILGTTGTGKSCTVALILRRILEKNPQAHILLLDVHREYARSFQGMAEVVNPDNMTLPFWLLNFDEAVEILIGQQNHREVDVEILRELIPQAKARYMANQRRDRSPLSRTREAFDASNIGVDTPLPFRTSDLVGILDEHIGKLDLRNELAPYKRLKARLESISRDPRYAFMFGSLTVQDNMAQVLSRLFRIPVNGKPIAIIELGGLPSEIINVVVSVLARLAFDFAVWSQGRIPITFICEEAHRYVPIDKTLGFEPTKRAISRIAKEGRKYGVSLCIVTQRPAELDPTILSQCNTIFSMRLTNERDQEILRAGISDTAASLMEFMTTMGTGEAVAFGEGMALPTRISFDMLPANILPRSTTASFTQGWARDLPDDGFLNEIVSRWRAQTYNPEGAAAEAEAEAAHLAAQQAAAAQAHAHQAQMQAMANGLRRTPPPVQPAPGAGGQGFAAATPHAAAPSPAPHPAPPVQPAPSINTQGLASLIRQLRPGS
ncbi:MAG TPA: DUF87 domain-containing protein [Aestuariivirga sp.]|nr:DUF87 domain-containing protein [Aestuariivirga sp.]